MEYLLVLKNGIGNKIFILANMLHRYPKDKLFVVDKTTHHQEGRSDEKVWFLFPALKEHPRIEFITWRKYDELKDSLKELAVLNEIFTATAGFVPRIKSYFHPNQDYEMLEEKLDFKKGIFVHVRLGDKLKENMHALKAGKPQKYIVLKPEYYLDNIRALRQKDEPVYILSDDLELAERILPGFEYPDLNANETFYCFWKARRVIISESTLSISAVLLGAKKKELIVPNFWITPPDDPNPLKLKKSPYFSDGESNKKYIMQTLQDYKELIKSYKST